MVLNNFYILQAQHIHSRDRIRKQLERCSSASIAGHGLTVVSGGLTTPDQGEVPQ
jgi:hypothetical protein